MRCGWVFMRSVLVSSVPWAVVLTVSLAVGLVTCPAVLTAADVAAESVGGWASIELGWQGHTVTGRWNPVRCRALSVLPNDARFEVIATDPEGQQLTVPGVIEADRLTCTAQVPIARLDSRFILQVTSAAGDSLVPPQSLDAGRSSEFRVPHRLDKRLVVLVGISADSLLASEDSAPAVGVELSSAADLPISQLDYDPIARVVLTAQALGDLTARQSEALEQWVKSGGHVVVFLSQTKANWTKSPAIAWLPWQIGDSPVTVRDLTALETFVGKSTRLPIAGRLLVPRLVPRGGVVIAGNRDDAILVRSPCGFGAVTTLVLDPSEAPLSRWTEFPSLLQKLLALGAGAGQTGAVVGGRLAQTGVTDLGTQVAIAQDRFAEIPRGTPWAVMGILLLSVLAIGPLDYVLTHYGLRRPVLTWLTFPVLVAAAAASCLGWAMSTNQGPDRANLFEIVDYDLSTSQRRQNSLWTVYSSRHQLAEIEWREQPLAGSPASSGRPLSPPLKWFAAAEDAYGALYRPSGLELTSARYRWDAARQSLVDVPIAAGSSRTVHAELKAEVLDSPFAGQLISPGVGRLAGTLTHSLPGPLENWWLVYGNRVYRWLGPAVPTQPDENQPIVPWQAGQELKLDDGRLAPREIKAFVTRTRTTSLHSRIGAGGNQLIEQTAYDPLNENLLDIARVLTFHEDTGGISYTGLKNLLLESMDFSEHLRLGQAVLIGTVEQSASQLLVNQQPPGPGRRLTVVRAILPVERTTQELPRTFSRPMKNGVGL